MLSYFTENNQEDFDGRENAIVTINHIIEIGKKELEIMKMNRIKGSVQLIRLYKNDIRYRRSGFSAFIICLLYIILFSKKRRNKNINLEEQKTAIVINPD